MSKLGKTVFGGFCSYGCGGSEGLLGLEGSEGLGGSGVQKCLGLLTDRQVSVRGTPRFGEGSVVLRRVERPTLAYTWCFLSPRSGRTFAETQPNHNRDSTVRSEPYVFLRPNKHCLYRKSLNPD